MSREDKSAVLMAAKKLKRVKNKPDIDSETTSGKKNFKNNDDDEGIFDSIIDAVSKFGRKD